MSALRASAAALTVAALGVAAACSSFESSEATEDADAGDGAPPDPGADSGGGDAAAGDAAPAAARLYVYGGYDDESGLSTTDEAYSAPILVDGSLGAWERAPELDTAHYFGANVVTPSGRIVYASGHRRSADAGATDLFFSTSVETTTLAPLAKLVEAPPVPMGSALAIGALSGNFILVAGGQVSESTQRDEVYVSSFDTNGALAPWSAAGTLPLPLSAPGLVAIGSRLYLVGGANTDADASFAPQANTYFNAVGTDGTIGSWTATGDLPGAVWGHHVLVTGGRIFSLGGRGAGNVPTSDVSTATPKEDGTLEWAAASPMPAAKFAGCAVAANSVVYVLGGVEANGQTPNARVFAGRVGANGGVAWSELGAMPRARGGMGCAAR